MAQRPVADAVGRSERHSVQAHTLEPSLPHNPHISCLSSAVTACMISGASAATAHRLNSCSAGIKRASPRQWPWAPALWPQGHHGVPDMACRARPLTTAIASSAACCTLGMDRIVHFSLRVTFPACGAAEPVHVGRL